MVGASSVSVQDSKLKAVLEELENKIKNVNCIKAYFYQTIFKKGIKDSVSAQGEAWFKRPNFMRWEYKEPEKQLIIANGKTVFLWEVRPNQVMVFKRERFVPGELGKVFFPSVSILETNFNMKIVEETKDMVRIKCVPKENMGALKEFEFTVTDHSRFLKEIEFEDVLGTKTKIEFKDVVINPGLDEGIFQFKVPKDAKVYYQD